MSGYWKNVALILLMAPLALAVWGCSGEDPEIKELISELREDDAEDRHDAVKALENAGKRAAPAAKPLGKRLKDDDSQIRYRAAKTLAKLGADAKPAIVDLAQALNDENEAKVKYYCAKAIVEITDQDPVAGEAAVEDLIAALQLDDTKTLYYVVKALGKIGAAAIDSVPELEKLADDPDDSVRRAVESAIAKIKKRHSEVNG